MFKKFFSFLVGLVTRPEARAILSSWERVFNENRTALILEMAVKARPIISTLSGNKEMTGSQKRDYVVNELTSLFKSHAATFKAGITEATLKDIALLATQQQFVAQRLDK
jgi:hypothetical protein